MVLSERRHSALEGHGGRLLALGACAAPFFRNPPPGPEVPFFANGVNSRTAGPQGFG
jgi:hypothetical protein